MKLRRMRAADGAEVNMTPMLDVVFILLIFFVVTATFLRAEGIEMIAPPSDSPPLFDDSPSILVQIDASDLIFVNGRLTDPSRVSAAIDRQNVDNGGESGVVIQPDPDASHGAVTRTYDAASAARVSGVVVSSPTRAND